MPTAINNGTFTFSKEELKDWSKVIHALTWDNPELSALHAIDTGIQHNMQIVFANYSGLLGKKVTGCTPNEIEGILLSEKMWTPVYEDFRLKHCSADVNQQDKLINQMSKMNPDFYNLIEGTQKTIGDYLVAAILERFKENLIRKVWLNDTAALTIAGGGNLKNGTDIGYFNTFNGFYKQIFTEIPSTASNYVAITENAGVTAAAQELATGRATAILKSMIAKADSRLLANPSAKIYATRAIFDGYLNDLEATQNNGAGNTSINENGQLQLRYRGIEIINMSIVSRDLQAYFNNGTVTFRPHRVVLSTPENLRIGTLATEDFGTVDAFYDRTLKTNFIDGVYTIDAKHMESYLTVAAY